MEEATAAIKQQVANYAWPADVDRAAMQEQVARGLYQKLRNSLPAEVWEMPNEQFSAAITAAMDPKMVDETAQQLRRVFCLGSLLARSYDLQEDKLVDPANAAATWHVGGDAASQLIQSGTATEPFAELRYDFSRGDKVVLTQTFTTSFPVERLHRLQLSLRTDDTWHALDMFVEKNGKSLPRRSDAGIFR